MAVQRNAIITGSMSGIGLGIARALADAGYNIVINGFEDGAWYGAVLIIKGEVPEIQI